MSLEGEQRGMVTGSLHRGDDRFSGFPDGEGQGFQTKDAPRKPLPLQDHKFHCGIYLLLPTTVLIPKVITVQKTSCRTRRQDTIPAVCILFCFVFYTRQPHLYMYTRYLKSDRFLRSGGFNDGKK